MQLESVVALHTLPQRAITLFLLLLKNKNKNKNNENREEITHPFWPGACATAQGTGSLGATSEDGRSSPQQARRVSREEEEVGQIMISKRRPCGRREVVTEKWTRSLEPLLSDFIFEPVVFVHHIVHTSSALCYMRSGIIIYFCPSFGKFFFFCARLDGQQARI